MQAGGLRMPARQGTEGAQPQAAAGRGGGHLHVLDTVRGCNL